MVLVHDRGVFLKNPVPAPAFIPAVQKENERSDVTVAPLWRVFNIVGRLDIRPDVRHREALVLFAGTGGAFAEILLARIKRHLFSAVDTDIFTGTDFLAGTI